MNKSIENYKSEAHKAVSHALNRVLREVAGGNQAKLARKLGVSPGTLTPWLRGESLPGGESLVKLADLGYSAECVLGLKPEDEQQNSVRNNVSPHDLTAEDLDRYVKVNRYDVEANAGHGALVLDEHVIDQFTFKRGWVMHRKGWEPAKLALIRVRGDSMEPTLYGGDLILVNSGYCNLHDGLWVIRQNDGVMAKRLHMVGENEIEVISDNRDVYPPYRANLTDGLAIIGEIVWFCREVK